MSINARGSVIGSGRATPLVGRGRRMAFPPAASVVTLLAGVAWHRWSAGGATLSVPIHTDDGSLDVPAPPPNADDEHDTIVQFAMQ